MVKRVVADLIALHPSWRDLVAQYELVAAQARPEWGESTDQLALRGRIDDIARQINEFMLELEQIGCVFKGKSGSSSGMMWKRDTGDDSRYPKWFRARRGWENWRLQCADFGS